MLLIIIAACTGEISNPVCKTGFCEAKMILNYPQDAEGYYHVSLPWDLSYYPYFEMYVEATRVAQDCQYNGLSVIEAYFDTNTYWITGDSLAFAIPRYNPFTSLYTSPYWAAPLPVGDTTIILSQYAGLIVPIVQTNTRIYLKEYFSGSQYQKPDEYKPANPENYYWSKRIIGPISPILKGDTATVFMKVYWDCGDRSIERDYEVRMILE